MELTTSKTSRRIIKTRVVEHPRFTEWAQQYGGIFSLKLGPSTAVVITDKGLVKALIDKKSSIYSNRPPSYVSHDLITRGDHLLVMQHGDKWRKFRKLIHQQFNEGRVETEHVTLVNAEATQMMRDFFVSPEGLMLHPKRFSNSIIMCQSLLRLDIHFRGIHG